MNTFLIATLITSSVIAPYAVAAAAPQESRAALIAQQQQDKADGQGPEAEVPASPPTIIRWAERMFDPTLPAIVPTIGGVRPGSGFAPGVGLIAPAGRSRFEVRAAWSTRNTKRVEASLEVPPDILGPKIVLDAYWEDASRTYWYGRGMQSSATRHEYGLTTREMTAEADMPVYRAFHVSGRLGHLATDATTLGDSSWIEAGAAAFIDTRTSAGYTRRGGLYALAFDHFAAQSSGHSGFSRLSIDARQFVPLLHENWVLAGQVRADLTRNADDTPYFLLPYLGGGSSLRGFSTYRFVDRQAVLVRGEVRWMASPALDMAAFVDQGVVGPTVDALRIRDRATGWGIGARFHGDRFTALRLEIAHSRDGWRLHVGRNMSF